jgi:phosphoadenosine phosphosulfate reductase
MFDQTQPEQPPDDILDSPGAAPIALRGDLAVRAKHLNAVLAPLSPAERLVRLRRELAGTIVFTLGFGVDGQLIFHWICEHDVDIDVVTLDTGRLFPETYALWAETEQRYGRKIRAVYPDHVALESLVARQGIDGFYDSKAARQACCDVRKTGPLDRVLAGAGAWISGLRADQSATRRNAGLVSVDTTRRLLKVNPLIDWSRDDVLAAAKAKRIPVNPLHAKGYVSIGCAPCTRAIAPGEPERNGRWWWESGSSRECGLHVAHRSRPARPSQAAISG